jgi:hypothetical protein
MGCGIDGMIMQVVGPLMQSSAAGAEQKGMNNAIDANLQQMRMYQRQGQGLLNQGIAGFQPGAVQKDIQQGQGQFLNAANQATATGLGGQIGRATRRSSTRSTSWPPSCSTRSVPPRPVSCSSSGRW